MQDNRNYKKVLALGVSVVGGFEVGSCTITPITGRCACTDGNYPTQSARGTFVCVCVCVCVS